MARSNFLRHALGYFSDPSIAFVQTPQDFYNREDSFEHQDDDANERYFSEQAAFYRVIAAAKNHWGGAFWCGTCVLVRLNVLRGVGGVATETATEDIHTSVRLHQRGWRSVYHNEVLARGLAASDANGYLVQRHRWAAGAMQVLRIDDPLFVRGLSLGQRMSYANTILGWFDAWRTLAYSILPMVVLTTGAIPIRAPWEIFVPVFVAVFAGQSIAMQLLTRGRYRPLLSTLFEVMRMPAVLPATFTVLRRRRQHKLRVSHKGRSGSGRDRATVRTLIRSLTVAAALAFA